MAQQKWTFYVGLAIAVSLGALLGGFNFSWSNSDHFPAYGIIADLIAVPVLIALIIYVRRVLKASSDEFFVAKKRFAAQTGFIIGFLLFAISGVFPLVFKTEYHQFIASLDGANEGFIMGRVFGMAPFIIGLIFGQFAAWQKYR